MFSYLQWFDIVFLWYFQGDVGPPGPPGPVSKVQYPHESSSYRPLITSTKWGFSLLQIVFSCREQQKYIVALVSVSNCVYELYTPASCSRPPLKDVSRKKQRPWIVYLCRIRLPPTWWNIISMLIFTSCLQVCSIFKHLVKKKERKKEKTILFSCTNRVGFW